MNDVAQQNYSEVLTFKIDSSDAIDVDVLARSLISLAELYKETVNDENAKIQISEIRKGSYEFDFIVYYAYAVPLLPIINDINIALDFIEHLKILYKYFFDRNSGKNNTEDNIKKPTIQQADNLKNITAPIVAQQGATINIITGNNNQIVLNNKEAKIIERETENFKLAEENEKNIKELETTTRNIEEIRTEWIEFTQAREDEKKGNKIICKKISDKELSVSFDNEFVQQQIMNTNNNIFNYKYLVELKVLNENDKTTYIVTALKNREEKNKQINISFD